MRLSVLLIAGGGFQGEGLAAAVRAIPGARVVVFDSIADNLGRHFADRYVVAPPLADAKAFAAQLLATIRSEFIHLVLPCGNRELETLAALAPDIESAGARVAVSCPELLRTMLDKLSMHASLQLAGLPTQLPVELQSEVTSALFGKPRAGWGSRDLMTLAAGAALDDVRLASLSASHCWVPWIDEFREFSADLAIDFSARISPITLRERLRTSGGFAIISESSDDAEVRGIVEATANWLAQHGGRGLFNIQAILPRGGGPFISDVNFRHGTSSVHALGEGNHLVAFLVGTGAPSTQFPRVRSIRSLQQRFIPIDLPAAIRAVVFDLDDTLLDQKRWMLAKVARLLPAVAGRVRPEQFLATAWQVVDEGPHDRMLDCLVARLGIEIDVAGLIERYRQAIPDAAPLYDDVEDVLRSLREARVLLGLLSDNPPESQRAKLSRAAPLAGAFDAVVFAREAGAEKPDTAGFLAIATKLGIAPAEILMVGDNPVRDAFGAQRAGYAGCMLVQRSGSSGGARAQRFFEAFPELHHFCWFAADLRDLPFLIAQH